MMYLVAYPFGIFDFEGGGGGGVPSLILEEDSRVWFPKLSLHALGPQLYGLGFRV